MIFGRDYLKGDIVFTKTHHPISRIISAVQDVLDDSTFDPAHVLIVQDEDWGIESAEKGVRWCRLWPVFNESSYFLCRPPYKDETTPDEIIRCALKYYGRPYDYTGLAIGFPLALVTKFSKLFKPLRRTPIPLHLPGSFVCSAFVAQVLKDTGHFDDVKLLREWHPTRITPAMLLREFPWRYIHEHYSPDPDTGAGIVNYPPPDETRPDNPYHHWGHQPDDSYITVPYAGKG